MNKESIQTIIRHLKGITASLEKELTLKECKNIHTDAPLKGKSFSENESKLELKK